MSAKTTEKNTTQHVGIGLFVLALAVFIGSLTFSHYQLSLAPLQAELSETQFKIVQQEAMEMTQRSYPNSFAFLDAFRAMMADAQAAIKQNVTEVQGLTTQDGGKYWNALLRDGKIEKLVFPVAKASSQGLLPGNAWLFLLLSIGLGIVGACLYILPQGRFHPGIKNHHIYHSAMHNKGWLGIAAGTFLIGFYLLLYFYPEHMVNWILMVDPISMAIKGQPASQWFLYGFLYTIAILVMGVRMMIKYRHNKYQLIRTGSVMFFQTTFAFMLPEIMSALNQPSMDLKNIWPLNYTFFFGYNLDSLTSSGYFGLFLLFWGIILMVIGVPVLTYFFGKRWYCSWVCGCGGLAETLGDPYRQLSDKSTEAWQIERIIIHGVLTFAVIMTIVVIYSYLPLAAEAAGSVNKTNFVWLVTTLLIIIPTYVTLRNRRADVFGRSTIIAIWSVALLIAGATLYNHFGLENYSAKFEVNRWVLLGAAALVIGALVGLHRYQYPSMKGRKVFITALVFLGVVAGYQVLAFYNGESEIAKLNQFDVRGTYSFLISSIFAGVIGTGFYPLMGNRVWCRFGCPLAGYLGIVQRLNSKFRITSNGSQCISCGNCSTYCEMGIDVRAYAQRGQDIVRASCVGCGICAAVCPRGVLRLENGTQDIAERTQAMRAIHISESEVRLLTN
ncbi:MAG: 4Fe-4S dicluster domain-containing protein [Bacteroidota bacterium]